MADRKLFSDRIEAGRELAGALWSLRDREPVVVGLPRGGVPVAAQVAEALGAPLDVCVVRKVGAPYHEELGMGAVSEGAVVVLDPRIISAVGASDDEVRRIVANKSREVDARCRLFRPHRAPIDVKGRTVIIVDDGVATGSTARAAIRTMRARQASWIVFAAPVGASAALDVLRREADEVVCVLERDDLFSVGEWYVDFSAVSDDEVVHILQGTRTSILPSSVVERSVTLELPRATLEGDLVVPAGARAIVLFAHGSGSGRQSPRNRAVARRLQRAGIATLLFDLLTRQEAARDEVDATLRFDIPLLTKRLAAVTDWVADHRELRRLAIGYFGASTGAAAAIDAAAHRRDVRAIVSRGGRTDLAMHATGLRVPTLLVVGSEDRDVLALNRTTSRLLAGPKRLAVVRDATHLFEEPGTLEQVAELAAEWFGQHLVERGAEPRTSRPSDARPSHA